MRVLITGCSSGFGGGAAVELTKRGHEVISTARRPEVLDDLDVAQHLPLDVDSDESVRDAYAEIVLGAGDQMDDETFEATMRATLELDW